MRLDVTMQRPLRGLHPELFCIDDLFPVREICHISKCSLSRTLDDIHYPCGDSYECIILGEPLNIYNVVYLVANREPLMGNCMHCNSVWKFLSREALLYWPLLLPHCHESWPSLPLLHKTVWLGSSRNNVCYVLLSFNPEPLLFVCFFLNFANTNSCKCIKSIGFLLDHSSDDFRIHNQVCAFELQIGLSFYEFSKPCREQSTIQFQSHCCNLLEWCQP